jgi:octaprenyl-diphosphate synthase
MSPYKDLNIILSKGTSALVEGETMQAAAAKEGNLTRELYYQIIARKTAALFQAAAQLGGALADAPEDQLEALAQFGYKVGLAFQIVDDILDLLADSEQLGKTAGIDLAQGKGVGTMYAAANGAIRNGEQVAVAESPDMSDPLTRIKQKILEGNAINEARDFALLLSHQAIDQLDALPDTSARRQLIELAHLVVNRDY